MFDIHVHVSVMKAIVYHKMCNPLISDEYNIEHIYLFDNQLCDCTIIPDTRGVTLTLLIFYDVELQPIGQDMMEQSLFILDTDNKTINSFNSRLFKNHCLYLKYTYFAHIPISGTKHSY